MFRSCNLFGRIPDYLQGMTALKALDLSFNSVSGSIPSELQYLNKLQYMYLTSNMLTGPIPSWVTTRDSESYFDLSYNNFSESSGPVICNKESFTDNQKVDRAYRIGQIKDVTVYTLITCGTIEKEKMYRVLVFKGGLFKTATEHKEQTRYFTQQDLKELFSLPKDGFDVSPTQLQLHEEHGDQISMSDLLKDHIKLLESLGIGGVSHHSMLYSKSDPTPKGPVEEEEIWRKGTTYNRHFGGSTTERPVDGSQHAFKPKDVNTHKVNSSPKTPDSMTESEIKDRIRRLSQLLSNKAMVSKLPDKGEKLRKQMSKLAVELENLVTPDKSNEVIELDDTADKMHTSLRV